MDMILIIAILLLLLGVGGGVFHFLGSLAWVLVVVAIIVIAWRVITGRRPVAYYDFDSRIPPDALRFTLGDIDTF